MSDYRQLKNMPEFFEVRPLQAFTAAEIWPIIHGYETLEIDAVDMHETDLRTLIDIRLVSLNQPFRDSFFNDFSPEECQWHLSYLEQGYSFGAYRDNLLIGFALAEPQPDDHLVRIWEFHVAAEYRRMGVRRVLMGQVCTKARQHHWRAVS